MLNLFKDQLISRSFVKSLVMIAALLGFIHEALGADIKLPVLGDSSSGIVSKKQEYKLGKAWLQAFRRQVEPYDDPLLQSYLEQLCTDLAVHSDLDDSRISLVLVNNPNINAFAVPGGIIGIHTGIFSYADNEDQLASIISHELAHLSQRHFARGIEARRTSSALTMAALLATIIVSSKAGSDAGMAALSATQAISIDKQLRHSRSNEQEADRLGLKIMANAGRDPRASAAMLEKMMALTRFKGSRPPEFLLTHPITERRVSDTKSRTLNISQQHYPDNFDYYIMQARVRILLQDNPSYSIKYFSQQLTANNPNPDALRYGLAMAHFKAGDYIQSKNLIVQLLKKKPQYRPYIHFDIEVDIAAEAYTVALKKLEHQLELNQHSYPLTVLKADALWKSHQYEASAKTLNFLSKQRPEDPFIWYKLAEIRGLAGNISGVHIARAEYFILIGALGNAKRQLKYAEKLLKSDFKGLSIVQQRLLDINEMEQSLSKL